MTVIKTADTPLSPHEIQTYRNLVKTSIVVIVLFRLGRPTGPTELAKILGLNRETVAGYLESLNMIGLVTRTDHKGGYRLTNDGRQLMLHVPAGYILDETHTPSQEPHVLTLHQTEGATTHKALLPGKATSEFPTLVDGVYGPRNEATSRFPTFEPSTSEFPTFNVQNSDVGALKTLKKEEESLNLKEKDSSSFLKSSNVQNSDVATILAMTDMLFDEPVVVHGLDLSALDPDTVLGWVAQAWDQRDRLSLPAGLIYQRLKAVEKPKPKRRYQEEPGEYLPAEYMHAISRGPAPTYLCQDCELVFTSEQERSDHWLQEHYQEDPPEKKARRKEIRARIAEIEAMKPNDEARIPDEYIAEWRSLHRELFS